MTNAAQALWDQADRRADELALRERVRDWTYEEVCRASAMFTRRLRDVGITPDDRVLLVEPTAAEFAVAYYGILAHGAVVATVNTLCTETELAYFIKDAGCSLVVAWHETSGPAEAASAAAGVPCWPLAPGDFVEDSQATDCLVEPRGDDDDPAVLLYTSGTTGQSKGAVLTHGNILAAAESFAESLELDATERLGTALPLFHVFGQVAVLAMSVHAGCSLSLLRPFSGAGMVRMAADHRLTILSGVPTMWIEMLHASTDGTVADLSDLRLVRSGGAALPMEIARIFQDRFGATVLDGYGLSETTAAATFSSPDRPHKEGSVGQSLPGVRVTLLDESRAGVRPGGIGEVAVSGPTVMQRYWNRPEATAEVMRDGWFLTGDLGRMDEDGYLWIVDRKKDLVSAAATTCIRERSRRCSTNIRPYAKRQ